MRSLLVIAAIVIGGFLVLHVGKVATAKDPPPHGHSNSTAITFKTMQTYRTVTVTPDAVNCGGYCARELSQQVQGGPGLPEWHLRGGRPGKEQGPDHDHLQRHPGLRVRARRVGDAQRQRGRHPLAPVQQRRARGSPLYRQARAARVQPVHGAELQPGKPPARADHWQQRVRRELPARWAGAMPPAATPSVRASTSPGRQRSPRDGADTAQSWTAWVIWTAVPQSVRADQKNKD